MDRLVRRSGWWVAASLLLAAVVGSPGIARGETVVEVPILAAIQANNLGVFELLLLRWDRLPMPSPIELHWQGGNIQPGRSNLSSMARAFQYAIDNTPRATHTGTVSAIGIAYAATGTDGPRERAWPWASPPC